jgi:hypothetical protein
MAHFAQIDKNNIVIDVVVVPNEQEHRGQEYLSESWTGTIIDGKLTRVQRGGTWIQTSYNTRAGKHIKGGTPFRKNYAGIGYTYDSQRDAFIPPKKYQSWILDEETCLWNAPVPYPNDGNKYTWDESTISWIQVPR